MEINNINIEAIVKSVLQEMTTGVEATKAVKNANTAKVGMMTAKEKIEIKEFNIPEIGDDEILVKVEGCGICGTDVHEYKNDPFGLIPVVLGHEGTGEIIKMGKNIKRDSAGKSLKVGDKIVLFLKEFEKPIINSEKDSNITIDNFYLTNNNYSLVGGNQGHFYYDEEKNEIFRYKLNDSDQLAKNRIVENEELRTSLDVLKDKLVY